MKVCGKVEKVSAAESLAYFSSRPEESQLAAWASAQSRPVSSRQLLMQQFNAMKEKFKKGLFHPYYLNRMCGIHMRSNQLEKALVFGRLNVELFPENANIWDTLGEVYYKMGDRKKALKYYQKALSLDPQMDTAIAMIAKLKTQK